MDIGQRLRLISMVMLSLAAASLGGALVPQEQCAILTGITGLCSCVFLLCGLAAFHISSQNPARSHTWRTLLVQYLVEVLVRTWGYYLYRVSVPWWGRQVARLQEERLLQILHLNCKTEYGEKNKLGDIKSRKDYVGCHPLTDYSHYEDYIGRMVAGEDNILFTKPVEHFAYTSGTTGKNKIFPLNRSCKNFNMITLFLHSMYKRGRYGLGRVVALRHRPKPRNSPGGVNMAPWSYYNTPPMPFFVIPDSAYVIANERTSLYAHALFGLADRDVSLLDGFMATLMYSFFMLVEETWPQLCEDIELGRIDPKLDLDDVIRADLNRRLQPDPERAQELRKAFSQGFESVCVRVWPRCRGVHMLASGSFAVYAENLMQRHTKGLRLLSIPHGASEGMVGMTISDDPDDMNYVILPTANFYEFIHEDDVHQDNPRTIFLEQLVVGQSYEVVITNECGLYRYRLGDVIRVVGHVQNCPAYTFQYRIGQALNVSWEKLPESVLYETITSTVHQFEGVQLCDYTAVESIYLQSMLDEEGKHYVLFIELAKDGAAVHLTSEQTKKFDELLCRRYELYGSMRAKASVAPMRVLQVQHGGFLKLKDHILKNNPTMQFKMPRVLRRKEHLEFLLKLVNTSD